MISGGLLGLGAIIGGILMGIGRPGGFVVVLIATILAALFFGFQLFKGLSAGSPVGRDAVIFALSLIEILILIVARAPVRNVEMLRAREHIFDVCCRLRDSQLKWKTRYT